MSCNACINLDEVFCHPQGDQLVNLIPQLLSKLFKKPCNLLIYRWKDRTSFGKSDCWKYPITRAYATDTEIKTQEWILNLDLSSSYYVNLAEFALFVGDEYNALRRNVRQLIQRAYNEKQGNEFIRNKGPYEILYSFMTPWFMFSSFVNDSATVYCHIGLLLAIFLPCNDSQELMYLGSILGTMQLRYPAALPAPTSPRKRSRSWFQRFKRPKKPSKKRHSVPLQTYAQLSYLFPRSQRTLEENCFCAKGPKLVEQCMPIPFVYEYWVLDVWMLEKFPTAMIQTREDLEWLCFPYCPCRHCLEKEGGNLWCQRMKRQFEILETLNYPQHCRDGGWYNCWIEHRVSRSTCVCLPLYPCKQEKVADCLREHYIDRCRCICCRNIRACSCSSCQQVYHEADRQNGIRTSCTMCSGNHFQYGNGDIRIWKYRVCEAMTNRYMLFEKDKHSLQEGRIRQLKLQATPPLCVARHLDHFLSKEI